MSYVVYHTKPNKWNAGRGSVYVIELNPAEVMRYRVKYNRLPLTFSGYNRRSKLVWRYWHIGKWHGGKRHLREAEEKAQQFINALKAGVKHIPDWEREERNL